MRTRAAVRILKAAVLIAAGAAGGAGCRKSPPAADERAAAAPSPDQVIQNFTMDNFEKLEKRWMLRSPEARLFDHGRAGGEALLEKPRLRFYTKGRPSSNVNAGRGRIETGSKNFWAWDGVVMRSTEGAVLKTEALRYDAAEDRLISTTPVTIVRGATRLRGTGWSARSDLSNMEIQNQRSEIAGNEPYLRRK